MLERFYQTNLYSLAFHWVSANCEIAPSDGKIGVMSDPVKGSGGRFPSNGECQGDLETL